MRSPGWSGQDLGRLAGRAASDVHTLALLDTVCSTFPCVSSGILARYQQASHSDLSAAGALQHPEPPSSHTSEGGSQPICVQVWWGLPVCQGWAWLRPHSSSGPPIRDVEVRHDLAGHTELMESGCPQRPA